MMSLGDDIDIFTYVIFTIVIFTYVIFAYIFT